MESWDLYDINRKKTGEKMTRGEPIPENRYRVCIHVCIFNSNGDMLIQHRVPTKDCYPDRWDFTAGGAAISGEESSESIHRELYEEMGIDISFEGVRPRFTFNFADGFGDMYTITRDIDLSALRFQPEEVDGARWASLSEILSMIDDGSFVPYNKDAIRFIFAVRDSKHLITDL